MSVTVSRFEKALIVPSRSMRSTLMWRGGVWVRYVGAGRRAAVVTRQAGLAATASITPVPSTPYGPTSRISRSETDSLGVALIPVSFQLVLSSSNDAYLMCHPSKETWHFEEYKQFPTGILSGISNDSKELGERAAGGAYGSRPR